MKRNLIIVIFLTLTICGFSHSIPTKLGDTADEQPIEKFFEAQRDVRFLLRTRANRAGPAERLLFNNLASVQQSSFDRNKPLRVLIHGWQEDETSDIKIETSAELLNYNDYNVIFVDWSDGSSTINYVSLKNVQQNFAFAHIQNSIFISMKFRLVLQTVSYLLEF